MKPYSIAVFVGSLRKESFNRQLAHALVKLGPPDFRFQFAEIGTLPLYNQDDDEQPGAPVRTMKALVSGVQGLLFVTPEYNRSIPGVLKNALDHGSRPYGQSAFDGRPGAVVSVSPGAIGAFGANQHLRQMMVFLNVPMLQQPEAYVGGAANLFDDKGNLTNPSTREFMGKFMQAFAAWIERHGKK